MILYILACLYTVFLLATDLAFIAYRKQDFIKHRGWQMVVVSSFVSLWAFWGLAIALELNFGSQTIVCESFRWQVVFVMPLWVLPFYIRSFLLLVNFKAAQDQLDMVKVKSSWYLYIRSRRLIWAGSFMLLMLLLFLLMALLTNYFFPPVTTDIDTVFGQCLGNLLPNEGFQGALLLLCLILLLFLLWPVQDTYQIKTELAVLLLTDGFLFLIWCILIFNGSWGNFIEGYVGLMSLFITQALTTLFPLFLIMRAKWIQSNRVSIGGQDLDWTAGDDISVLFGEVIKSERLRLAFEKFCIESFCSENLAFYQRAEAYEHLEPDQRLVAASTMRELFFAPYSSMEINIDEHVRATVIERIDRGEINASTFLAAKQQVLQQMLYDSFVRFLRTDQFQQIWNAEIISKRSTSFTLTRGSSSHSQNQMGVSSI